MTQTTEMSRKLRSHAAHYIEMINNVQFASLAVMTDFIGFHTKDRDKTAVPEETSLITYLPYVINALTRMILKISAFIFRNSDLKWLEGQAEDSYSGLVSLDSCIGQTPRVQSRVVNYSFMTEMQSWLSSLTLEAIVSIHVMCYVRRSGTRISE